MIPRRNPDALRAPVGRSTAPEVDGLPRGVVHISKPLEAVVERLTLRINDIVKALGVSRPTIERQRAAGRFPKPDLKIGKSPLWKPETIRAWIDSGGGS